MAASSRLLEAAREGRGGALFVIGELGLGKTAVLEASVALARDRMRVVTGQGDPMETSFPLGLMLQAFEALDLRDAIDVDAFADPARIHAQFTHVLRRLEALAPARVLIAFDDLQWADRESLDLLAFLVRRVGTLPVAIVATAGGWPPRAHDVCQRLAQGGFARLERLAPLSEASAKALLLSRASGAVSDMAVRRALLLCSGNPLLLEQMSLGFAQGTNPGAAGWLPPRTEIVISSRFGGMPPEAVQFAQVASVFGSRFRLELVAEVAELEPLQLDSAIDVLARHGILRVGGGTLGRFVHPLIRRVLYNDLPSWTRIRLHGEVFKVLMRHGLEEGAGEHAILGHLVGDVDAITLLETTGHAALRGGNVRTAIDRLRAAAALGVNPGRRDTKIALGEALLHVGRSGEAIRVFEELLASSAESTPGDVPALRFMARALNLVGETRRAIATLEKAADVAAAAKDSTTLDVLVDLALVSWAVHGVEASRVTVENAISVASTLGARERRRAYAAHRYISVLAGDGLALTDTPSTADWVIGPKADLAELAWSWGILRTTGDVARFAERFDDAERLSAGALSAATHASASEAVAALSVGRADTMIRLGRLEEAVADCTRASRLADHVRIVEPAAAALCALALLHLGRIGEHESWFRRAEQAAAEIDDTVASCWLRHARAVRALNDGEVDRAADLYLSVEEDLVKRLGVVEPCVIPFARDAVEAYVRAGRPHAANDLLVRLDRDVPALPCVWPKIALNAARALVAEGSGDLAAAEGHHAQALLLHDLVDLPLERVRTLIDYSRIRRRTDEGASGRAMLMEAIEVAERHSAVMLAARAKAQLTAAGGRRRRVAGAGSRLTPAERRIVALILSGKTNQATARALFVSVRTVETHLQHVYTKLKIRSRNELILMAAQLQDQGDLGG
jgi:DNA-binding CsgD family transcriptional regulator/tetratricopeptide (TPR) repeat protein